MKNKIRIPELKVIIERSEGDIIKITNEKDIEPVLRQLYEDNNDMLFREVAYILLLNAANNLIGYYKVASGGIVSVSIDPRVIFTVALTSAASSIIFAHNHPSGQLRASKADINMTKRIKEGGRLLNIELLDSLIITETGFYSLLANGEL